LRASALALHRSIVPNTPIRDATPGKVLEESTRQFYLRAMDLLDESGIPYLVGGAYSLAHHAGITRHTKDFDIFVNETDCRGALKLFADNGYRTELTFPHWLGKVFHDDDFVDVIFGSGNGLCRVDDDWFKYAVAGTALGRPAKLCPAEEIIWTKSFVQERERFDGADINHLILARGISLDWDRMLRRFEGHEQVLLGHLMFFDYVYPAARGHVPGRVVDELLRRIRDRAPAATDDKLCRGTLLSRAQYLVDLNERGCIDARLQPHGRMSAQEIAHWTKAIDTIP
jgi:hypothetical protein